jgi:hypothetical protein
VVAEVQDRPTGLNANENRCGLQEQAADLLARGVVRTRGKLREPLAVQNERLGEVLESLERAGRLGRTPTGWKRLN